MAIHHKGEQPVVSPSSIENNSPQKQTSTVFNPRLLRVKEAANNGNYSRALELLPADSQDPEILNCYAVCLMRMHRFEEAFGVLRRLVVHQGTQTVRPLTSRHIRVNFATALFYGGRPAGGIEVLDELKCEEDPAVQQLRLAAKEWVSGMGFLRRLDWKVNRVAPKKLPMVPPISLGRFSWDLV